MGSSFGPAIVRDEQLLSTSNVSFLRCDTFPFTFSIDGNESHYARGVQLYAGGNMSTPSGCIFPTASCALDTPGGSCCKQTASSRFDQKMQYLQFFMMGTMMAAMCLWMWTTFRRMKKKAKKGTAVTKADIIVTPDFVTNGSKLTKIMWKYGFSLGMVAEVLITINLQQDVQKRLSLSNRNVQAAAAAFLGPLGDIFSFIEDTMTVRISQAMAGTNKARTNQMVRIGVVSALVLGVLASTVAVSLSFIKPAFVALINPGALHDRNAYPGCALLPNSTELAESTQPFWIMSAVQYPAAFLTMVLTAIVVGSGDIAGYGWMSAIGGALMPIAWFTLRGDSDHRLTLLGITQLAGTYFGLLLPLIYARWNTSFHRRTGITFFGGGGGGGEGRSILENNSSSSATIYEDDDDGGGSERTPMLPDGGSTSLNSEANDSTSRPSLLRELMADGLMIMCMDLTIELRGTIGYYLALYNSHADAYILNAAQAAMPQFGWGYMLAWSFLIKILGPRLIEQGAYDGFLEMTVAAVGCAIVLGASAIVFAEMYSSDLELYFGESACEFAASEPCFILFDEIFIKNPNIAGVFGHVFGLATAVDCIVLVVRPALLACMDFKFLFYSSIATFVCIYVPAIVVAVKFYDSSALAIYIAMVAPIFANCIVCVVRLALNIRRMKAGLWPSSS